MTLQNTTKPASVVESKKNGAPLASLGFANTLKLRQALWFNVFSAQVQKGPIKPHAHTISLFYSSSASLAASRAKVASMRRCRSCLSISSTSC